MKNNEIKPNREYKDSAFCLLFSEPKRAVELYNAITGENLPLDTELTYTTLENALYIDRNNDIGFVINNRHLVLVECQSTVNMNIPFRCLGYVSRTLENLADGDNIYGTHMIKFPAPEFYVFYVGSGDWNVKQLRLSEAFLEEPKENSVELVVNLVNLNYNKDAEILQKSPSLHGYSKLLFYIREEVLSNGGNLGTAIEIAVQKCIKEGQISDFLKDHSREVTGMLFKEISMEEYGEIRAREAYDIGHSEGEQAGAAQEKKALAKAMQAKGLSPELIKEITGLSPEEYQ
jgi:hypothetical protein